MAAAYSELPDQLVSALNGIEYAYRDTGGEGGPPLVLLQHFRGNLDNWDPALIDALASARRVITFDNAGVGGSTGTTPDTIEQMARDAIAFLTAMGFGQVDLLGFSIGSFVALHPVRRQPAGGHRSAPTDVRQDRGRDRATTWATREAQYDAVCTWGIPDHALLQRVTAIGVPVFVANGDRDPMILPHYSYLLAGLIPHARVKIYPDSAHGFLFQDHAEFAADVEAFLATPD
jgi:pimeloyl-ACP methyl ester carboxylesterase